MSKPAAPATLNVYVHNRFSSREGAKVAAVIVARDPTRAVELLNEQLREMCVPGNAYSEDVLLLSLHDEEAVILADGSY